MDVDSWAQLALFLILILCSAFFSGSESAFFSLTELDLGRLRETTPLSRAQRRVLDLMARPRRLLLAILIGNTSVNVAAATVSTLFIHRYWPHGPVAFVLEVVVVTLALLIFAEVSPKILAVKQPEKTALRTSWVLRAMVWLFYPLVLLLDAMTRHFTRLLRVQSERPFSDAEELKALLEVGEENGALDENEREMIHSIFEFRETVVREVMVPRTDIVQVEKDTPVEELLEIAKEMGHSRIPVFDDQVDNVVGILHVKDLLPYMRGGRAIPPLSALVRPAYFVPESKMIGELLREFQQQRIHMAIIVDEYGGTAGLVTLEDIIEEIVGEIRDEYDHETPLIDILDGDRWRIDGKISISELNEALELGIPEDEEYDSLGGFILSHLGHIPTAGEEAVFGNLVLSVETVESQRIQTVVVSRKPAASPQAEG